MQAFRPLRDKGFLRLCAAVAGSELGDSFHYIALMWFALEEGGPLGVVAVRLAGSVPALLFGFLGGAAADRWNPKRTMIVADLLRAAVLVPVSVAGLLGELPLWGLVAAAFVLETATSYFGPAYGVLLPAVVSRENVLPANALIRAVSNTVRIGGWGVASALLLLMPISTFFVLDALSFVGSALLVRGVPFVRANVKIEQPGRLELRETWAALRALPSVSIGMAALAIVTTVSAGVWIGGIPEWLRTVVKSDASGFSVIMTSYAVGSVLAGAVLTRWSPQRTVIAGLWGLALYLPGYAMVTMSYSLLPLACACFVIGVGQGGRILLTAAVQEEARPDMLGKLMGVLGMADRGAHALGTMLVAPLFAILPATWLFAGGAVMCAGTCLAAMGLIRHLVPRAGPSAVSAGG